MPRDERALRRSEFRDGPQVRLADGQLWTFPRPRLRIRPIRNSETGRIEVGGGSRFGADFDAIFDELIETPPEDSLARWALQFELASVVLSLNYNLTDDDLAELLDTDMESQDSTEMWKGILPVLTGQAPKPSPDGSATP